MSKLVAQLTRPVRWDLCTETLRQSNVTAIVEFPPAGTLAGIAKRELQGVPTHAVKSPADLDGLSELSRSDSRHRRGQLQPHIDYPITPKYGVQQPN